MSDTLSSPTAIATGAARTAVRNPTLLIIPTYNEAGNIQRLLRKIHHEQLDVDVLVIDDNSPDGTAALAERFADRMPLAVMRRPGKLGIGSAHRQGVEQALAQGYTYVMTMDADFAHHPSYLRTLLAKAGEADVVVASRYVDGGGLRRWTLPRRLLTHLAHGLTTHILRMPHDCTGGFRLYTAACLRELDFSHIRSEGYAFLIEMLFHLRRQGRSILEVPIVITSRHAGTSKISRLEIWKAVQTLIRLRLRYPAPLDTRAGAPPIDMADSGALGWDDYWRTAQRRQHRGLYARCAEFYRRYLIAPLAVALLSRYFHNEPGRYYLHAGCGSGGSDQRLRLDQPVFHALDLSLVALQLHRRERRRIHRRFVCGDLFALPYRDGAVDGIFNFGVMEHFIERDIDRILREFHRVLKPEGRVLLFWPPNFGLSVLVLSSVLAIVNRCRRQPLRLYPDEVSRVKSFAWVRGVMARNGFRVLRLHFGPRDLFTFVVVVAERS